MTSKIHGKYEIRMTVSPNTDAVIIKRIYNAETKIVYIGNRFIATRKAYDNFLAKLDKDFLPTGFRIYKKPKDIMTKQEIERIIGDSDE